MAAARGTSRLRGRLTLVGINYFSLTRRSRATSASLLRESISHDTLCLLMLPTELAVGLEPLNTLYAAHRSPRSFAAFAKKKLVPPLNRPLVDLLSETKNCRKF